jgi:hypothetical protein
MAVKKSKTGKKKPGKGTGNKPSPPVVRAALVSTQNAAGCSDSVLISQFVASSLRPCTVWHCHLQ